jgi:precorrin-2 dehydrogenase/sirohydrochlorin ferrochelatase
MCVIIGGGKIARRKVQGLLAAGARVRVVAPHLQPELQENTAIELICRPFLAEDLAGAFLVFAATNDRQVNAEIAAVARQQGTLVNSVDDPEGSDFHLPAVLQRGALTVAVSSGVSSPAFAAQLRDRLAAELGPEWQSFCALAAALRQKRLTGGGASAYNLAVISDLFAADLPRLLARQDEAAINRLLAKVTGVELTLADLGIQFGKGTT